MKRASEAYGLQKDTKIPTTGFRMVCAQNGRTYIDKKRIFGGYTRVEIEPRTFSWRTAR